MNNNRNIFFLWRRSILCVTHQLSRKERNYPDGTDDEFYKVIPDGTCRYWVSIRAVDTLRRLKGATFFPGAFLKGALLTQNM